MNDTDCTDCAVEEELHAELATLLSEYSLDDEQRRAILADARKRRPRDPRRTLFRRLAAAAAVLLALGGALYLSRDRGQDEPEERVVFAGPLARVTIEPLAFAEEDGSGLYLRLTVENHAPREIGVDLAAYADLLHRSGWSGTGNEHQRKVMSMRYGEPQPVPPERRDAVIGEFKAGGLFRIPPGGSADIYRKFDAFRERKLNIPNAVYLAIGTNPLLLVTDGVRAELITTSREESSQAAMDRLAKRGIEWATLPAESVVIPLE